ncbi:MAG: Spo0B domain-containing protein [Clostridiales bacterium]|nr:Spo0B domain-containing protein [Clostridiales bacterium]
MKKKILNIENQVSLIQIFGIVITILLCMVVSITVTVTRNNNKQEEKLLRTAKILASSSIVIEALQEDSNNVYINNYLDIYIKSIANLDFLAVCDTKNVCIYYPNKSFVGRTMRFGDEWQVLSTGESYISTVDRKYYGLKMAYTPVYDRKGTILGYVLLSVFHESSTSDVMHLFYLYMAISFITAFVGIFIAISVQNRTRKILRLTDERSEVIDALDEAIVAINLKGEVIMANKAFFEMLGCSNQEHFEGKLEEIFPETELIKILETGTAQYNISVRIHGEDYVSSRIPVYEKGHMIGAASISRNVTEIRRLAQELSETTEMINSLRSFNHEFMNKIHVILGYLETKNPLEAKKFILNNVGASSANISKVANEIESTGIAAIIIGKMVSASNFGIKLDLIGDSYCKNMTTGISFDFYVTILGNLLENSIDELKDSNLPVKEINIGLFIDEKYTVISVTDTGRGMTEEVSKHIFERGYSTKGVKRGTGLFLVKELVDKYYGTIEVDTEPGEGTSITVSLERNVD